MAIRYHPRVSQLPGASRATSRLLILGGGFTGAAVARRALAAGARVLATTRHAERADSLRASGVEAVVLPELHPELLSPHVDEATRVLVTFPPDGATDRLLAPRLSRAASVAYVSSTGVYGDTQGKVDEDTPTRAETARGVARVEAEAAWRAAGAVVVRAPGIYGPGRGMHLRLARGAFRIPGDGTRFVSRVHVDDLAAALWSLLARGERASTFVMGDAEPAPHLEVVRWLSDALGLPLPPHAPLSEVDETLRNDRRIDASRLRSYLELPLAYPTYREGFTHCLAVDRDALALARSLPR